MTDPADLLRRLGLHPGAVVGQGMEGVVVALPDGLVAKVWHEPAAARARASRAVLDALAAARLPFATPRVLDVLDADGVTVTVERRLPGTPLDRAYDPDDDESLVVDDDRVACLVDVLTAFAAVPPSADLASLPPLPGEAPIAPRTPFAESLAGLVERRARASRGPLVARLGGLDVLVAATGTALRALAPAPPTFVHGDLVPGNVHVDASGTVVAVLDVGFLTMLGDAAFDAAVTASVYDMYGPRHRASERVLDDALGEVLGCDPQRRGLYRAAYALATATVFSPDGTDGHFEWCAAMLERDDVREAVLG